MCTDDENSDEFSLMDDLRNIQTIIAVTRNNIDALTEKSAVFENPPQMFLNELVELSAKMIELKEKEDDLLARIQQMDGRVSTPGVPDNRETGNENSNEYGRVGGDGARAHTGDGGGCSGAGAVGEDKPKQYLLRAYLPNKQRTSVQVMPGRKLRDALIKALRRRNMHCEMCEVRTVGGNEIIPWDMDISLIEAKEVQVTVMDKFPIISQISHQFIRKTFFSLAFCECCRRLLFTGFYCNQCNFRFHQRCADKVPPMCKSENNTYYKYLLDQNPENCVNILSSGGTLGPMHSHSRSQPRTLNQQDRSNSAPNVCINSVKPLSLSDQQKLLRQYNRGDVIQYSSNSQMNHQQEHSQSTQASPTNTLRVKRPRARSADESNKNLLSPKTTDENWVSTSGTDRVC